ncbi:MAG: TonB family protein [Syntrophobacterales bacterium]|jgi:TonB family protein|nr:TonB family protein [Syntrophobacterales bacterium]
MSEAPWYKWLVVSILLHFAAIAAFSIPFGNITRKIDLSSAYSVNLVGEMGGGSKGLQNVEMPKGVKVPVKETPKPARVKQPEVVKEKPSKPTPVRLDKSEVSINKKKVPVKETPAVEKRLVAPSKEELEALNRKLRQIRKRTDQLEIGGSSKAAGRDGPGMPDAPFAGEGTGQILDLATQKYLNDLMEKIHSTWGIPGAVAKNLLTVVTIKIRKDGKITDMDVDARSGNRIFDESIMRALKAIDPLPPLPTNLGDFYEVQLKFRPEGMS